MLKRVFQGFRLKPMHTLGKDTGCYLLLLRYACNSENLSVLLEVSTRWGWEGGLLLPQLKFSTEDYSLMHRGTDPCMLLALHV